MPSYSISQENYSADYLKAIYFSIKVNYPSKALDDLDIIFNIALKYRDRFPSLNLNEQQNPKTYIERWVKGYYDTLNNPPHNRIAKPKSSCTDPAIRIIVQSTQQMTETEALICEKNHNLFMSAENIQGNLLEEYISMHTRQYGFIWCAGNVLRAIDFCNTDGTCFLQVKNKSNTENSSSSNIREGTAIEKWYRLGTKVKDGTKQPDYKWEKLNSLINTHKTEGIFLKQPHLSETEYIEFLSNVAFHNRAIISDL